MAQFRLLNRSLRAVCRLLGNYSLGNLCTGALFRSGQENAGDFRRFRSESSREPVEIRTPWWFIWSLEAVFRPSETLRPQRNQPLAVLVEVDQSEGRQQPLVILLESAIAHLGLTEDTLQNAKGPFHLGAHSG